MANAKLSSLLTGGADGLTPALLEEIDVPLMSRDRARVPYEMDDGDLVQAAMTALLLGQPLILAGNPGVGKTQFAIALANRLGLDFLPPHQVKSTDEGRDLLYQFDQVGRYRSKQQSALASHVNFTALGLAIIRSAGPDAQVMLGTIPIDKLVEPEVAERVANEGGIVRLRDLFPKAFQVETVGPRRAIVLLDELDKAPRDAPNDILGEIENMRFRIPDLDIVITADRNHWPVVVITTNSERSLPDAFLRRCVFHWIEDPGPERLIRIVALHLAHQYGTELPSDCEFLTSAASFFYRVANDRLNKPPATAEFVAFVFSLFDRGMTADDTVTQEDDRVRKSIGTLLKTRTDRQKYYPARDGTQ